jgi:hypothetical protein
MRWRGLPYVRWPAADGAPLVELVRDVMRCPSKGWRSLRVRGCGSYGTVTLSGGTARRLGVYTFTTFAIHLNLEGDRPAAPDRCRAMR